MIVVYSEIYDVKLRVCTENNYVEMNYILQSFLYLHHKLNLHAKNVNNSS